MKRRYIVGMACLVMGLVGCTDASERTVGFRDESITADVEAALRAKIPGKIDVNTRDQVVTLSGTVPDVAARERAAEIAADVKGVERVDNNLRATIAGDAPAAGVAPNPPAAGAPANPPPAPEIR
jgi:Flp pilus assembly secretin CpaC